MSMEESCPEKITPAQSAAVEGNLEDDGYGPWMMVQARKKKLDKSQPKGINAMGTFQGNKKAFGVEENRDKVAGTQNNDIIREQVGAHKSNVANLVNGPANQGKLKASVLQPCSPKAKWGKSGPPELPKEQNGAPTNGRTCEPLAERTTSGTLYLTTGETSEPTKEADLAVGVDQSTVCVSSPATTEYPGTGDGRPTRDSTASLGGGGASDLQPPRNPDHDLLDGNSLGRTSVGGPPLDTNDASQLHVSAPVRVSDERRRAGGCSSINSSNDIHPREIDQGWELRNPPPGRPGMASNPPKSSMTILLCNCRGNRNPDCFRTILDLVCLDDPDILVLTETRTRIRNAQRILSRLPFDGVIDADVIGYQGGIWMLWRTDRVLIQSVALLSKKSILW
ncbi:Endonuclease/exonuclease/phosphatase [Corchorus capsularis]|uniref:Endonuclease/exonuclease/phosphatase n=1 Tax=Corchorus capsularis TaxID=210143 RepID=A0A1R3FZ82_COCAP|nr:Endonuclease/exonuclease/phosphatase [Corchorus capsularis]